MSQNTTTIVIRPLRPSTDIGAITKIYADAVIRTTATYEIDPPGEGEMRRRLVDSVQATGFPCFVAEEEQEEEEEETPSSFSPAAATNQQQPSILGYAYITPYRPRPAYRYTVEHSVYVAPGARRRGVGRRLMTAIIRECEKMGFRQIIAVIGEGGGGGGEGDLIVENNNASVRFHQELGFRISGTLQGSGYKFGRWLDTTLMQLSINGGSHAPVDPESVPEIMFYRGNSAPT
jgi:L-amino acid N-acyltransferase YncA